MADTAATRADDGIVQELNSQSSKTVATINQQNNWLGLS